MMIAALPLLIPGAVFVVGLAVCALWGLALYVRVAVALLHEVFA